MFKEKIERIFYGTGKSLILFLEVIYWVFRPPYNLKNLFKQLTEVGVRSFAVVALISFSTGMVLALQTGLVTQRWFGYPVFVGMIVGFSLVKELGPVLTAVVVAGRVGAAIAAEIGTMKITEQLDALHTLGTNPVKYLAVPRFIACIIMVPILTVFANVIGILGGMVVSTNVLGIPSSVYLDDILNFMYIKDLMHGLIKSVFFAIIVAWVSLYKGFTCEGGAEGVGKATTSSVVLSIVFIMVSDYFLSCLLIGLGIGSVN